MNRERLEKLKELKQIRLGNLQRFKVFECIRPDITQLEQDIELINALLDISYTETLPLVSCSDCSHSCKRSDKLGHCATYQRIPTLLIPSPGELWTNNGRMNFIVQLGGSGLLYLVPADCAHPQVSADAILKFPECWRRLYPEVIEVDI